MVILIAQYVGDWIGMIATTAPTAVQRWTEKGKTMDNTREKLIELLVRIECNGSEEVGCCPSRKHEFCGEVNKLSYCTIQHIADHLIAHGVTFATDNNVGSKWIPVTERAPENDYGKHWKDRKHYLVLYQPSGLMCVANYGYKQYDWWIDSHGCVMSETNYKEVTHWMPLPEPPKGE